ncbi:MAG: acetyl-CoA carboxylase biotin carboxyl carrier protein subunit [Alphaproteobacteria bacterium]
MGKLKPDEDLIRRLAELLEETGLTEIEYEAAGQRIRVGRHGGANTGDAGEAARATNAQPAAAEPGNSAAINGEDVIPAGAVTSPMVGTVFVAAEPGATPLVSVGDPVKEGQTLLIIEAMKVMNPLASPRAGRVTQILINDGQPVEFGEPLLVIE